MNLIKWQRGGRWVDNDEGWHYRHCSRCGTTTEHGITEGCVPCGDRHVYRRRTIKTATVSGTTGDYTVKLYPNGKKYCDCKGFRFRKACKHTAAAKF